MEKEVFQNKANSGVAPLPFRSPRPQLPSNREQANVYMKRLQSLRKTLERKPEMKRQYTEFIKNMLDNDHAELAPPLSSDQEHWYLPSFGVYHPQKPDQLRVVFGEEEHGHDAKKFIMRHFYVDDGLASTQTSEEAVEILKKTQNMLAQSNLKLHKIASNDPKVVEAFPVAERAKDLKDLDLELDDIPLQRSLGVLWNLENDCFTFQVATKPKPYTRRGVLATVNSLYDPLGFVSPITMQGKALLRELSAEQRGWDEPLPVEREEEWINGGTH